MYRVLLVFCILLISACDDPAPVGVGLVDEQSGDPQLRELSATSVNQATLREITGNAPRALFGQVNDPLLGTTEAIAYLDFVAPGILTSAFQNGQVTNATLLLAQDYVYGDTTLEATVRVKAVNAAWLGQNVPADTTLSVGPSVTSMSSRITGRQLQIPLTAAWISQWDPVLRGSNFDDSFFGFEISSETMAAIGGIAVLGSSIRAISGTDTTYFPAARSLTRLVRTGQTPTQTDRLFLQDGSGKTAAMTFDLATSGSGTAVLNRGILRVSADSSLSMATPTGFVRPLARSLQLDWVLTSGARATVANATLSGGRYDFESLQLVDSLNVFYRGASHFDHFEIRVAPLVNGLSVVGFPRGSAAGSPRLLLAVTPVE